jgi:hypothetical protein
MRFLRRLTLSTARDVGIDVLFLLALTATALAGFGATYTGKGYFWVGMLGAVLAVLTTVVVGVVLRWPLVVSVLVTLAWFSASAARTRRPPGRAAPTCSCTSCSTAGRTC